MTPEDKKEFQIIQTLTEDMLKITKDKQKLLITFLFVKNILGVDLMLKMINKIEFKLKKRLKEYKK